MKIVQMTPTLSYGDAVGNDILAIRNAFQKRGISTLICAENVDPRLPSDCAVSPASLQGLRKDDLAICHCSTGTDLNDRFCRLPCHKVLVYHNITPPVWFSGYDPVLMKLCMRGRRQLAQLAGAAEYAIADSEFNRQDLMRFGFRCPIDVIPIVLSLKEYAAEPSAEILSRYNDGRVNILFCGRIAPNKKIEDVIRAFFVYHRGNPESRLFLVGSTSIGAYYRRLQTYIRVLGIADDVVFPGHIPFDQVLAYYRLADVFLCMSEHEGFCVPLVESMIFGVPVVARDTSAIAETLGGSGLLLKGSDPFEAAAAVGTVVRDKALRNFLVARGKQRLADFDEETVSDEFIRSIVSRYRIGL